MHVCVNPPRQDRQATQVVVYRSGLWVNSDNLRTLDNDAGVAQHAAAAIEQCARGDDYAFWRRRDAFVLRGCLSRHWLYRQAGAKGTEEAQN